MKKILLIEDDESIKRVAPLVFGEVTLVNSKEDIKKEIVKDYDFILMDYELDKIELGLTGGDVMGWIKDLKIAIPIIGMSGDTEHNKTLEELGAVISFNKDLIKAKEYIDEL